MITKFIGLGGLPRSGATLLSSILSQNPEIHAEGNSAVCQLMTDMQQSCYGAANEQLNTSNRLHTVHDLVASIPTTYYKDVTAPIIIDKCRTWMTPDNTALLSKYFNQKPKVIVMERQIADIVKSFVAQAIRNGNSVDAVLENFMTPYSEPIMKAFHGCAWAKHTNKGEFLFIAYDDLVDNTKAVLDSVYEFCEILPFNHDLTKIINIHPENDALYNNSGLHDVRPTIGRRKIDVVLPEIISRRCNALQQEANL
jgi:hypothetical protein